jgi:NAD(P)-dependent dehydrogenase (short-subunit alcohol dehydrogenase family)
MNRSQLLLAVGAGFAAAFMARAALRRSRRFSFAGRTVLVSGGSRGMGLVLARQLVDAGARVAILARTAQDLAQAERELRARGGEVLALTCDVGRLEEVHAAVQQTLGRFGRIDVLCNLAGIVQVGPLEAMTREDFRRAMDVHFWGALNTTLEVLPHMRRRGWGRIVNVASLGGKRAVPHMLPYTASKFALVGLSNGLRAELAKDGILVTTICPSLVRTGSPRNALFKGQYRKEYAWFSVADSLPGVAMSAERAARQILRACRDGVREVVLRNPANVAVALQSAFPGIAQALLGAAARFLPRMGGIGQFSAYGYESASRWSPSLLTRLGDRAALRNNEMRERPERPTPGQVPPG